MEMEKYVRTKKKEAKSYKMKWLTKQTKTQMISYKESSTLSKTYEGS